MGTSRGPAGNMMLLVDMKGKAIPELSAGEGRIFLFWKASRVLEPELFTALTREKVEIKSVNCWQSAPTFLKSYAGDFNLIKYC